MPAARMAQKVSDVEEGTHAGDVMGTIGVACSVFVSASMVTIFTLIGAQIIPLMPEFILNSFNHILPALFGAIYVDMIRKNMRNGVCTFIGAIIIMVLGTTLGINSGFLTLAIVIWGILVARFFFVRDQKKAEKEE